jgi:UDP-N-acetylglucosamine 4,6-dehydratase/5-epimerase
MERRMEQKLKVLITGATGTIGSAFIKMHPQYEFYNISRNEKSLTELSRNHPNVISHVGNIEDRDFMIRVFKQVQPDIVIHAAAMKHINIAEENPIQACSVNVIGSLNVIAASIAADVPVTIGVSTDKACSSQSVYGDTKSLMEKCFIQANTPRNKFALCRFANVAHSNGSVLPFWLNLAKTNQPLKLTNPDMNRLIFSQQDAVSLIQKTIDTCTAKTGGFICSFKMKTVNMLELAQTISDNIEIVGNRAGEKLNEDLISEAEIDYTYVYDNMVYIYQEKNTDTNKLPEGYSSATAEKMTKTELTNLIWSNQ